MESGKTYLISDNIIDKINFHSEHVQNVNETDTFTRNYLPFFPKKVPLKLNNCEIAVSTGIWQPSVVSVNDSDHGIELDFIFTAIKHMNASITVVVDPNSWHGLTQDESAEHTGRLALLKNEKFDMMVGSVPTHYNIFRDFDTSASYLPNYLTFVVPTAAAFPSSMILWSMFEVNLRNYNRWRYWMQRPLLALIITTFSFHHSNSQKQTKFLLLIVGTVLLLSIFINIFLQMTWKMQLNTRPKNSFLSSTVTTFLVFLRLLIETSTPTLPVNRTVRWLYGMWFGVCLIVTCLFNTTLTSHFTEPGRLKQLKTIQDIVDSNIEIAMNDLYLSTDASIQRPTLTTQQRISRYYPIVSADPVLEKYFISKNLNCSVLLCIKLTGMGKAATFADILRAEYIAAQWVSSNGKKSIQFITEGGIQYAHNLAFYRGNVFGDRINELVERIK